MSKSGASGPHGQDARSYHDHFLFLSDPSSDVSFLDSVHDVR